MNLQGSGRQPLLPAAFVLLTAWAAPDSSTSRSGAIAYSISLAVPRMRRRSCSRFEWTAWCLAPGWQVGSRPTGLDARLDVSAGRVILHPYRAGNYRDVGALSDLEGVGPVVPAACRQRRFGRGDK